MKIVFDPGTEKWIPWAQAKMAGLALSRVGPIATRSWEPEPGVQVWGKSSDAGDWLRITGGSRFRVLGFVPAPGLRVTPGTSSGTFGAGYEMVGSSSTVEVGEQDSVGWNRRARTYAYPSTRNPETGVVGPETLVSIRRSGLEEDHVIEGSRCLSQFDYTQAGTPAVVSSDGDVVVTRADVWPDEEQLSADFIFTVSRWAEPAGGEGFAAFEDTRVGLPPLEGVDMSDVALVGTGAGASLVLQRPFDAFDGEHDAGVPVVVEVLAHPATAATAVYAWVRYSPVDVELLLSSPNGTFHGLTYDVRAELWAYTVETAEWEKVDELEPLEIRRVYGVGAVSHGPGLYLNELYQRRGQPLLDSAGIPHLLDYDNFASHTTLSLGLEIDNDPDPASEMSYDIDVYTSVAPTDLVTVRLDGEDWFEGVKAGSITLHTQYVQLCGGRRGVMTVNDGTPTVSEASILWRWGEDEDDATQLPFVEGVSDNQGRASPEGAWLLRPYGKVYLEGELVYEDADMNTEDDPHPWPSYDKPGRFLTRVPDDTPGLGGRRFVVVSFVENEDTGEYEVKEHYKLVIPWTPGMLVVADECVI